MYPNINLIDIILCIKFRCQKTIANCKTVAFKIKGGGEGKATPPPPPPGGCE